MHKIFAKTLFLGKNTINLPVCHSTNEEAKTLNQRGNLSEGTIVRADYQENGKGQRGNTWESEPQKNLLFTILLKPDKLRPDQQYMINVVVSLALQEAIAHFIPNHSVQIKWPNDLYVNDRKIAGILTESTVSGKNITAIYCGIGLNVNQLDFRLTNATSMALETGDTFLRDDILEVILLKMEKYYEGLNQQSSALINRYTQQLRWLNELRTFRYEGEEMEAVLKGINEQGKLVLLHKKRLLTADIKEIEFID